MLLKSIFEDFPIFIGLFRDQPGGGIDSVALMDSIVDVIFFADILLNFHTTFVGPGGEVGKVSFRNLKSLNSGCHRAFRDTA